MRANGGLPCQSRLRSSRSPATLRVNPISREHASFNDYDGVYRADANDYAPPRLGVKSRSRPMNKPADRSAATRLATSVAMDHRPRRAPVPPEGGAGRSAVPWRAQEGARSRAKRGFRCGPGGLVSGHPSPTARCRASRSSMPWRRWPWQLTTKSGTLDWSPPQPRGLLKVLLA